MPDDATPELDVGLKVSSLATTVRANSKRTILTVRVIAAFRSLITPESCTRKFVVSAHANTVKTGFLPCFFNEMHLNALAPIACRMYC